MVAENYAFFFDLDIEGQSTCARFDRQLFFCLHSTKIFTPPETAYSVRAILKSRIFVPVHYFCSPPVGILILGHQKERTVPFIGSPLHESALWEEREHGKNATNEKEKISCFDELTFSSRLSVTPEKNSRFWMSALESLTTQHVPPIIIHNSATYWLLINDWKLFLNESWVWKGSCEISRPLPQSIWPSGYLHDNGAPSTGQLRSSNYHRIREGAVKKRAFSYSHQNRQI